MMTKSVKVKAPATVANLGCGYDTIGFSLKDVYEEIEITKTDTAGLEISQIEGAELSLNPKENIASIAVQSLLDHLSSKQGLSIRIKKFFAPGSGLGSSASSAAGAVYASNHLLGNPLRKEELLPFAMEGEFFASKSYHADNVAPCLLGGCVVMRSYEPLDYFTLPLPKDELKCLIIRPHVEIKTAEAKSLVPKEIPVTKARNQWGNVAGLTHAFHTRDWVLLKDSINDEVAEPVRKQLIPAYEEAKKICFEMGSAGFNISGAGPSMFSFFLKSNSLDKIRGRLDDVFHPKGISYTAFESDLDDQGCQIIEEKK